MTSGYRPEIDITTELGEEDTAYFHSLIGVLRWIVELGRVDINVEASMLSTLGNAKRRTHSRSPTRLHIPKETHEHGDGV